MAQQLIVTTPANTGTGDSPKSAFDKINANFTDLYAGGAGSAVSISYVPPFTGGVTTTVSAKLAQTVSILDFGADPTGTMDSTSAIQAALNNGGRIYAPSGIYLVSTLNMFQANTQLIGDTPSQNSLSQCTIFKGTTVASSVIVVSLTGGLIKGILFDRSVTASGGAGIEVQDNVTMDIENCKTINQFYGFKLGGTNYANISNCLAVNNFSHGFFITNGNSTYYPLQWVLTNCVSETNNGWGFQILANKDDGSGNITDPRFNFCGTFANNLGGYQFASTGNIHHNDMTAGDTYSSLDGGPGWAFENIGTSIVLDNCFAEGAGVNATGRNLATPPTNSGAGLLFEAGGVSYGYVQVNGFTARQNSFQGIAVASSAIFNNIILNGCQCIDNGQSGGNQFGIDLQNTSATYVVNGCISTNCQTSNQVSGIRATNGSVVFITGGSYSGNTGSSTVASSGFFNVIGANGVMPMESAFEAVPSAVQTFNTTSYVTANFQTVVYDNRSNFASNVFTAPVAGRYRFAWSLLHDATGTAGDTWNIAIVSSTGANKGVTITMAASANTVGSTVDMSMTAGSTAQLQVRRSSGTGNFVTILDGNQNYFCGSLIE